MKPHSSPRPCGADDDTLRLVYADRLDEHDRHERSEYIRVQCEFARLLATTPPPGDPCTCFVDSELVRRALGGQICAS
jgi:uncharacterized protein (TIGR02996 family)